jgi:rod shape-determining protein MreD
MKRVLFFLVTVVLGIVFHVFCEWYLSFFYNVGPQVLLLTVLAVGFLCGPLTAEALGFVWGLISDAMGVGLFGMNALLLPLAGYIAGKLRRRVASERPAAQIAIAFFGTLLYGSGVQVLLGLFDPSVSRSLLQSVLIGGLMNILLVTAIFWFIERWIDLWLIHPEQV